MYLNILKAAAAAVVLSVAGPPAALAKAVTPARLTVGEAARPFVEYDSAVLAIRGVRVIDGTGAPARADQTVVLRNGMILQMGPASRVRIPEDATVVDGRGKSLLPGLVQLHEHMWMSGPDGILNATKSYPRLYLAAGVTSLRTAGSYNNYVDLQLVRAIREGAEVGPWIDLTFYMDLFGTPRLVGAEDTAKFVNFWLDSGFTSIKAYRYTKRLPLRTAIEIAHRRGVKVTGHLCATTYAEAAEMGIDNVEHGFVVATDFMPGHKADSCDDQLPGGLQDIDPDGSEAQALIRRLLARRVAVTSTLVTYEPLPAPPPQGDGTELLAEPFQKFSREYRRKRKWVKEDGKRPGEVLVRKSARMELAFMRQGGLLVSGTDPAVGSMSLIAGFGSARQMEIMVANGFTPLETIKVGSLNGATYLGRQDRIGSIAVGKQADLILVEGDPSTRISDIRNVLTVFREGVGYDPVRLRASVRGKVGYQ